MKSCLVRICNFMSPKEVAYAQLRRPDRSRLNTKRENLTWYARNNASSKKDRKFYTRLRTNCALKVVFSPDMTLQ